MRYGVDYDERDRMLNRLLQTETRGTGRDEDEGRSVVHISDLITSLPQAWFKRNPEFYPEGSERERALTDQSKANMSLGIVNQEILRLLGYEREAKVRMVVPGTDIVIVGHADGVDRKTEIVAEAKTTAGSIRNFPSTHYFEQLAAYAVGLGYTQGRLYLTHRMDREGIFRIGRIEWEEEELEGWQNELFRRAHLLVTSDSPPWGEEYGWIYDYDPFLKMMNPEGKRNAKYNGWFDLEL